MGGYRAKQNVVLHRAIDMGVKPNAREIATLTGLARNTVVSVLAGEPVSTSTMATLVKSLGLTLDELFEPVPDRPPLRQVRAAR
jgi:Cro/C1-type HTH DNA-binding domain